MHTENEWVRVLELLHLSPEPSILVVAPDTEEALVALVRRRHPKAICSVLELPGAGSSIPSGAVSRLKVAHLQGIGQVFDAALFDHAVDDIVVEAVARNEGIVSEDTALGEYAPRPRAVRAYWRAGELETVAAPELVSVVKGCALALRRGGHLVLHHRVENAHLTQGQPMDLYAEYVPLARGWLSREEIGLTEVSLDSLDPQWWLCLTAK